MGIWSSCILDYTSRIFSTFEYFLLIQWIKHIVQNTCILTKTSQTCPPSSWPLQKE